MMGLTAKTPGVSTQTSLREAFGPETALWERRPRRDAAAPEAVYPIKSPIAARARLPQGQAHRREGAAPTNMPMTSAADSNRSHP